MLIVEAMAIIPLADGADRQLGITLALPAAALTARLSRVG
jgi:hypothetical protein